MKWIMQKIYEMLADGFMENGFYNVSSNSITFENDGKTYRLTIEEVKED